MTEFKPRKGSYIKERNGQFYYRRAIPAEFRPVYGGKSEWNIPLAARTKSDRVSEAHAYAHQHNREMAFGVGVRVLSHVEEAVTPEGPDLSVRLDFGEMHLPEGFVLRPFKVHRNGAVTETFKVALSRDPDLLRAAERDGFFPMSYAEGEAQTELNKLIHQAKDADNEDRREICRTEGRQSKE